MGRHKECVVPNEGVSSNVTQHHGMSRFEHLRKVRKTALQTCFNINADWHTFFLEAIASPLF
jgi:HD superfamily phosphohydrolase YqeK